MSKIQKIIVNVELRPVLQRMQLKQQSCQESGKQYALCAAQNGFAVKEKQCENEFRSYMNCLKKK